MRQYAFLVNQRCSLLLLLTYYSGFKGSHWDLWTFIQKFKTEMNTFRCVFKNAAEKHSQKRGKRASNFRQLEILIAAVKFMEANWP